MLAYAVKACVAHDLAVLVQVGSHIQVEKSVGSPAGFVLFGMAPPRNAVKDATKEFEKYFTAQYPNWKHLYAALLKDTSHVALENVFCGQSLQLEGCFTAFEQGSLRVHKCGGHVCMHAARDPACRQSIHTCWITNILLCIPCFQLLATCRLQPGLKSGPPPALHPDKGLLTHYWLDMASVLPVVLLGAAPGHSTLVGPHLHVPPRLAACD